MSMSDNLLNISSVSELLLLREPADGFFSITRSPATVNPERKSGALLGGVFVTIHPLLPLARVNAPVRYFLRNASRFTLYADLTVCSV
jgi:hypothetical protein